MELKDYPFNPDHLLYNENYLLANGVRSRRLTTLNNQWQILHNNGSLEDVTPDNQVVKLFRFKNEIGLFRNGRFEFVAAEDSQELEDNLDMSMMRSMGYQADNREVLSNSFYDILTMQDILGGYEGRYMEGLEPTDPLFDQAVDLAVMNSFTMPTFAAPSGEVRGLGPVFHGDGIIHQFRAVGNEINNYELSSIYKRNRHIFGLATFVPGEFHLLKEAIRDCYRAEQSVKDDINEELRIAMSSKAAIADVKENHTTISIPTPPPTIVEPVVEEPMPEPLPVEPQPEPVQSPEPVDRLANMVAKVKPAGRLG